jgi:hypothetical protein
MYEHVFQKAMATATLFATAFTEGDKGLVTSSSTKPVPGGEQFSAYVGIS